MEYHNDRFEVWNLNTSEKKHIVKVLNEPYGSNKKYTNWQYMCFQWNYENDLIPNNVDKYFEGIYDEKYENIEDSRLIEAYVPSTQEMPETWGDDDLLDEEIDFDEDCTSYMEMAVVAYEPNLNISVNQEMKRLSIAYFKVYDHEKFSAAKRVASLHFKDSGMEYHNDDKGKRIWKTNSSDIKRIIKLLQAPSEERQGYTNWQMACYRWNYQNGLVTNFKDYFDGKYDHKYDQDSRLKEAYVPHDQEMPETWGEDDLLNESIEFDEEYTDRGLGSWDDFAPGYVNMDNVDDFFVEMAEIYPKYIEDHNIKKVKFRVCIFEGDNEGPVPHVHVFFDHKWDKNHGKDRTVAYICLGTNEYAPQHDKETKILNSKERKALIAFFNAKIPNSYAKDKNGEIYQLSCWQECVSRWVQNHHNAEKYFEVDEETGLYVMPDYSEINIPKKNNAVTERINEILSFKVGDIVKESNDPDHIYVIKNISEFTNNKFGYDLVSINEDSNELYCHSGELLEFQYHDSKLEEYYKENIMESTGILDEEVIEEGDNSILLLEMAGKLKETAKPTKPKNEELIVAVGNDERSVAHFHVFRNQKDWRQWQNGACIMFEKNAYFDHSKNRAILKKEELEAIVSLLKSDINVPKRNLTNWEYLIELWNFNNDRYEIPYDLEMPSYSFDTIETFKEMKRNKKVYDESSNLLDEEVDDYIDKYATSYMEMAMIASESKLNISVNQEVKRLSIPYFKVYDHEKFHAAKRVARLHFKDSGMEYHNDDHGKKIWKINSGDVKRIIKLMQEPSKEYNEYTNWQMACYRWNYQNGLVEGIKDYFDGKYDHKYDQDSRLKEAYVHHDQEMPETWEESNDLLDESMDSDEDDNSILLLEMAGKLKETAKPTKPKNEELIVAVGNDERSVAHFHVFRNQKDWRQWQNGACIMFEKNAYFDHSKNRAILKKEELEAVVSLLKSDSKSPSIKVTNWEYLVDLWNQNNDRYEIPYDLEMPSYSFDTIQTYQETKDKKKVYDESGTLSHYIPDECPWSFE